MKFILRRRFLQRTRFGKAAVRRALNLTDNRHETQLIGALLDRTLLSQDEV